MPRTKGKTHVLSWPNMFDEPVENVNDYQKFHQAAVDAWGAQRRAFLSSCIRNREWLSSDGDEDCALMFFGEPWVLKVRDY